MRLELTGRHVTITPVVRALVEGRIAHTLRLLNDRALSAHVVLTRERSRFRAEVTLHASRERFLHGEAAAAALDPAFNAAADKVDRQVRTLKGKRSTRRRRRSPAGEAASIASQAPATPRAAGPARLRIIRAKQYAVKPMSIEDAAAEMGEGAEGFIVFRNSATDAVTVLFRRPDGHLGLIEPDV